MQLEGVGACLAAPVLVTMVPVAPSPWGSEGACGGHWLPATGDRALEGAGRSGLALHQPWMAPLHLSSSRAAPVPFCVPWCRGSPTPGRGEPGRCSPLHPVPVPRALHAARLNRAATGCNLSGAEPAFPAVLRTDGWCRCRDGYLIPAAGVWGEERARRPSSAAWSVGSVSRVNSERKGLCALELVRLLPAAQRDITKQTPGFLLLLGQLQLRQGSGPAAVGRRWLERAAPQY